MNTANETSMDNLSEGQLKTIALMKFNGDDYFIVGDKVFEGDEDEERANLSDYNEGQEGVDEQSFLEWCEENCTEVDEIDGDDEVDGYMVLTDDEANEKCAEYIKDSLWAFNADFIISHSKLPWEAKEMVESFQREKCEGANDTIEAMIEDIDEFIEDAISADGRGHFLNTYDGNENEETVNGETFYIYRMS